jgi:CRP/FNR family cyclic AMP-dependent transcriptional regulator
VATVVDPGTLVEIPLFRGLPAERLKKLAEMLRKKTVPAGTNMITADQPGEVVYVLLEGTVKILIEQMDGREVILAFLGAGDTVGEMSLVDSSGRSANVMTMEKCTFLWMDRSTFQELLRNVPEFAQNLVRLLSSRLRMANEQIQSLSSLDVAGRLARQILAFAERYGEPGDGEEAGDGSRAAAAAEPPEKGTRISLRLTQTDLAELVGASRERVNQVMVDFRQKGYLSVDSGHHILVHDPQSLARFCG